MQNKLAKLGAEQKVMQQQGIRRLLFLSGTKDFHKQILPLLTTHFAGDWPIISSSMSLAIKPENTRQLLGKEFLHAIFDATTGFHLDALAILAGTLTAGSFLVLLASSFDDQLSQPDLDSLRFASLCKPIATPNFATHFYQHLAADPFIIHWSRLRCMQTDVLTFMPWQATLPIWQRPTQVTADQKKLLMTLTQQKKGQFALISKRGRGKSTLAGLLATQMECIITAPNRASAHALLANCKAARPFLAPDLLLRHCKTGTQLPQWLLIDEAAMIPIGILQQLIAYFPCVLLTTTIESYEGTSRGFVAKFCAELTDLTQYHLTTPLRFAKNDPLEAFIDAILLQNDLLFDDLNTEQNVTVISYQFFSQHALAADLPQLTKVYHLLKKAHYKTTSLDLRRLLDAPKIHLAIAAQGENKVGALVVLEEGGLEDEPIALIWQGRRRPKGNLVPQALVAYVGEKEAASLYSIRVNRIVVEEKYRRFGIARQLIEMAVNQFHHKDYISVSFGYTPALLQFWQNLGFELVYLGYQQETSSGCYSLIMIRAISLAGKKLQQKLSQQLANDFQYTFHPLKAEFSFCASEKSDKFTLEDVQKLKGFADHLRSIETTLPALCRFLKHTTLPCHALRNFITTKQGCSFEPLVFSGKKAQLLHLRSEVKEALRLSGFREC